MQEGDVFWCAARDRIDDRAALAGGIRLLAKGHQLRIATAEPHQRRRNAVQRRPRHDSDSECFGHDDTRGGSPTTGRTNPPAASSSCFASATLTPRRTITMASL